MRSILILIFHVVSLAICGYIIVTANASIDDNYYEEKIKKIEKKIEGEDEKEYEPEDTYFKKKMTEREIVEFIQALDPLDAHITLCNYAEELCRTSSYLLPQFYPYLNSLYLAIVKHESGNFVYRRGLYDENDLGLSQVNQVFWTSYDLRKMGISIEDMSELVYDDRKSLRAGYYILWYNIVLGFKNGNRRPAIYQYASHYHSPGSYKRCYVKKVKKYFFKYINKS